MKLLLDTHTFIWWDSDPNRLSRQALALLEDQKSILLLSVTSIWEIQIKTQLGKLKLNLPLAEIVESQQRTNKIEILPITQAHAFALDNLPILHKDPFDRMLVAQANVEDAVLVTGDPIIAQYPVKHVW